MLHIVGMIGKGIGIALLCIVIVLIVLLLVILFDPIRYRVAGKKDAAKMPEGAVKVHWLFHIVTCFAVWEGKLHYGLKICGISIYDNLKKKRHAEKKRRGRRKREKPSAKSKEQPGEPAERQPETESAPDTNKPGIETMPGKQSFDSDTETAAQALHMEKEATAHAPDTAGGAPVWTSDAAGGEEPAGQESQEPPADGRHGAAARIAQKLRNVREKIKAFFKMLVGLVRKIAQAPKKGCEKMAGLKEKIAGYAAFLRRDDLRRAVVLCRKQLFRVVRHIRPRTVKADIRFGFDDPSVTGQILGVIGMLYPVFGKNIVLRPDFEEPVCSGEILIKGRITVFVLIRVLWILYFDKDIKRLIRIWKKEDILNGGQ